MRPICWITLPCVWLAACSEPQPPSSLHHEVAESAPMEAGPAADLEPMAARVPVKGEQVTPATSGPIERALLQGSAFQFPAALEGPAANFASEAQEGERPAPPPHLLADPQAGDEELADWHRGRTNRDIFELSYRLSQHIGQDESPLKNELDWLYAELRRRGDGLSVQLADSRRDVDYSAVHKDSGEVDLAFRQWVLGQEYQLVRQMVHGNLAFL